MLLVFFVNGVFLDGAFSELSVGEWEWKQQEIFSTQFPILLLKIQRQQKHVSSNLY